MHRQRTLSWAVLALLGLSLPALCVSGCAQSGGSGGGSGTTTPTQTGEITVALTDAATDEVDTFEVDVTSFRFMKANGATVEVLPQRARVDFSELVSVSEVIAAATLPVGTYTAAYMTLDFSGAAVRITGNTGAAQVQDANGSPLTGLRELQIVFPSGGFTVGAARGYFAQVDFDLDQSLVVDAGANTVQVDTVLYATINPAQPKASRVPGLASGYSGSSFDLDVRLGLGLISRGVLTVNTNSATVFDLGTSAQTGQAGFDALKALGNDTLVVAQGVVDPLRRTLAATKVVLLPQNLDEVEGLVVARTGGPGENPTLTLRGVAVSRAGGSVTFNTQVTLNASFLDTRVSKRGAATTLTTDAINVGQRILAYGTLSSGTLDLSQPGAGFVRMIETGVSGRVTQTPAGGNLHLDASRIGLRLINAFDFNVGGVAQLDPSDLVANTGSLGLAAVDSGSVVIARGFFEPVSATPAPPDFQADSVIDRTDAASLLRVFWLLGTSSPFTNATPSEATIDVSQSTAAILDQGLIVPVALTSNPTLRGAAGLFAVRRGLQVTLFTQYSNMHDYVQSELSGGAQVVAIRAVGKWDATGETMTATRAFITLR